MLSKCGLAPVPVWFRKVFFLVVPILILTSKNLEILFLTRSRTSNSVTYPEIWRSPYGDAASHYGDAASP